MPQSLADAFTDISNELANGSHIHVTRSVSKRKTPSSTVAAEPTAPATAAADTAVAEAFPNPQKRQHSVARDIAASGGTDDQVAVVETGHKDNLSIEARAREPAHTDR